MLADMVTEYQIWVFVGTLLFMGVAFVLVAWRIETVGKGHIAAAHKTIEDAGLVYEAEYARLEQEHKQNLKSFSDTHLQAIDKRDAEKLQTINETNEMLRRLETNHSNQMKSRDELICDCLPFALHIANVQTDTPLANAACRFLYITNTLGAWTADEKTSRILVRGQVLARSNPAELKRLFGHIRLHASLPGQRVVGVDPAQPGTDRTVKMVVDGAAGLLDYTEVENDPVETPV